MVLFLLWFVVPLGGLLALAIWGLRLGLRSQSAAGRALLAAVPAGALALVGYGVYFPRLVSQLTSSTSGLSYLGLPLLASAVGLAGGALGWAVAALLRGAARRSDPGNALGRAAFGAAAAILLAGATLLAACVDFERAYRTACRADASPEELRDVVTRYLRHAHLHALLAGFTLRTQNNHVLARVAVHPHAPEDVLLQLTTYPDGSVSRRAWQNPAIGDDTLRRLAASDRPGVRAGVAMNPRTPPDVLRSLAADPALDGALWQNPALPEDAAGPVLTRMAEGNRGPGSEYTRAAVADSRKIPVELLVTLSHDGAAVVREHVAFNRRSPAEVLERLARDSDASVRRGVAGNRAIPAELLRALAADPDPHVRSMARANPGPRRKP